MKLSAVVVRQILHRASASLEQRLQFIDVLCLLMKLDIAYKCSWKKLLVTSALLRRRPSTGVGLFVFAGAEGGLVEVIWKTKRSVVLACGVGEVVKRTKKGVVVGAVRHFRFVQNRG